MQWWRPALSSLWIEPHGVPQWLNSSSTGCVDPVPSKIFMVSLDLSLLFGYNVIALHFPILCTSGADRMTSQKIYTTGGLEQSFLSHQRQLCPAPGEPESTLPASQEARKDPALFRGSSVPTPFIQALPPALCLSWDGETRAVGCPCDGGVPGHHKREEEVE